mmetsp:Transcript_54344/g.90175  ORF Transcript_54344/g.90175 Transcript_54344/m.90175 type:complete len:112 (-) Transcript_54344:98-433(-)
MGETLASQLAALSLPDRVVALEKIANEAMATPIVTELTSDEIANRSSAARVRGSAVGSKTPPHEHTIECEEYKPHDKGRKKQSMYAFKVLLVILMVSLTIFIVIRVLALSN